MGGKLQKQMYVDTGFRLDYDKSSQAKNGWAEGQSKITVGGLFFHYFFNFGIVTMLSFQFLFKEGRSPIAQKHLKKNKKGIIGFWAAFKKSIILQKKLQIARLLDPL